MYTQINQLEADSIGGATWRQHELRSFYLATIRLRQHDVYECRAAKDIKSDSKINEIGRYCQGRKTKKHRKRSQILSFLSLN